MENLKPKIFIYSTDVDFCNSISLLFQTKYTTEYSSILVNDSNKNFDLLIIDVPVTEDHNLMKVIKEIKTKKPDVKILLLYVYRIHNNGAEKSYREFSDILLYKPIDVEQLAMAVDKLIFQKKIESSQE